MRVAISATVVFLLALCARHSAAQQPPPDDAGAAFQSGTDAYEKGQFAAAAREFERAYSLHPHAAAAFNEARALERSGNSPQAADAYLVALERGELRASDESEAKARLGALEQSLGRVELGGAADLNVSIGHVNGAGLPVKTHLAPGRYELSVTRTDGKNIKLTVPVSAGALTRQDIPADGPLWAPPRPQPLAQHPDIRSRGSAFNAPAVYFFGGALLATGVGTFLGLEGLHARSEFNASGQTDPSSHDRAVSLRTWADVAFAAGVGLGATGLVLAISDRSAAKAEAASDNRVGMAVSGSGVRVAFSQSF